MADKAHLAVQQGADAWNAWRAAHAGTPAGLANASFWGLSAIRAGRDLCHTTSVEAVRMPSLVLVLND
jgi:hypothetical protein